MLRYGSLPVTGTGILVSFLSLLFKYIYIYILLIQHAAKFTVTDEEVYCVCYPTDVKPAFRRTDQTCHLIFLCSFSLARDNDVWISEIFSYISSISAYVLSAGHLYSGAPPTQVDVDVEVAEANWYIYIFKLLYGTTFPLIQKSTVLAVISTSYCYLKCY